MIFKKLQIREFEYKWMSRLLVFKGTNTMKVYVHFSSKFYQTNRRLPWIKKKNCWLLLVFKITEERPSLLRGGYI